MNAKYSFRPLLVFIFLFAFVTACEQDDVQRPVTQYQVKYEVKSRLQTKSDFYIRFFNPKYSNIVSEYYDTIKSWTYEFKGKTFDHLYLEAFTVRDSSLFDLTIFVNGNAVANITDSCPGPITCDTNRVSIQYTLQ
jgi:hypothetical protein